MKLLSSRVEGKWDICFSGCSQHPKNPAIPKWSGWRRWMGWISAGSRAVKTVGDCCFINSLWANLWIILVGSLICRGAPKNQSIHWLIFPPVVSSGKELSSVCRCFPGRPLFHSFHNFFMISIMSLLLFSTKDSLIAL